MDKINGVVKDLVSRYPVYAVWLFGSQAKRTEIDPSHDVDIAVIFDDPFHMVHREIALAVLFGATRYKMDLLQFSKKQFGELLRTVKKVPREEDVWEPGKPCNPTYQIMQGKLLYSKRGRR